VSVVRDVSERKKAEQIRLSSVATVSHELRTPLTSIKGALRLLESGVAGDLGGDAARMVTVARRNSDRLLSIVNDILVLEKLSSGQIDTGRKADRSAWRF
jgi:two-component system sensor histidine kinase VicK